MLRVTLSVLAAWIVLAAGVAAEPPPLETYGALPVMRGVRLSPSGERYAMIAKVDGKPRVVVASAQNQALYVLDVGANKIGRLEWAGDDHVVVITSVTQRLGVEFGATQHELLGAFVISVPKRNTIAVFDRNQTRVANTIAGYHGAAQVGGRWFGYFGGYTHEGAGFKTNARHRLYPDHLRERTGQVSAAVRRWNTYMPAGEGADMDDISPVRLASKADAPVLLLHGRNDIVVPISQSQKMERALRAAGRPVELISLPGTDHWLLQEDSRIAMLKASVAFVLKHNPPAEEIAANR